MDLNLVRDELGRCFDDHGTMLERLFAFLDNNCVARDSAIDKRLETTETACTDLKSLRIDHMNVETDKMHRQKILLNQRKHNSIK